jgi:hypothetical protein
VRFPLRQGDTPGHQWQTEPDAHRVWKITSCSPSRTTPPADEWGFQSKTIVIETTAKVPNRMNWCIWVDHCRAAQSSHPKCIRYHSLRTTDFLQVPGLNTVLQMRTHIFMTASHVPAMRSCGVDSISCRREASISLIFGVRTNRAECVEPPTLVTRPIRERQIQIPSEDSETR